MPKGETTKKLWKNPEYRAMMSARQLGRKHSKASKLKMSLAKRGFIPWNKGKTGIVSKKRREQLAVLAERRFRGKKFTEEHKRKIGIANLGKKRPDMMGSKNPHWKGGITPIHIIIRNCHEMDKWKTSVFERDKYTCCICLKNGGVNAHHIESFSKIIKENNIKTLGDALVCKELWDIKNGITVCVPCHTKRHKKHQKITKKHENKT